jgi:four helix bundle protein
VKENNIILEKTFQFALRIVKLFSHLKEKKVAHEISVQLLKSGTSIGANVEEAIGASSRKDFIHKLEISYKEARETKYWLRLMKESKLLDEKLSISFIADCEEILKIIASILKTSKVKTNPNA